MACAVRLSSEFRLRFWKYSSPDPCQLLVPVFVTRLNWPQDLADHWRDEVQKHFAEALIEDASCLEPVLINDIKDRHVLATAIRSGASTIVTFNLRDFSATALAPWKIHAVHPADYLITLYTIAPEVLVAKLGDMGRDRNLEPRLYVAKLGRSVPAFAMHVAESLGWSLDGMPGSLDP